MSIRLRIGNDLGEAVSEFFTPCGIEAHQSGSVTARGKDGISGTKFTTAMQFKVEGQDAPPQTTIPIKAECEISGRLAHLIESGANMVIKRMTAGFAEKLAEKCGGVKSA